MNPAAWRLGDKQPVSPKGYAVGQGTRESRGTQVSKDWCAEQSIFLPARYDPKHGSVLGRVLDTKDVRGVKDAVEKLNQTKIYCPENHCIVWSASANGYFLLYRNITKAAIMQQAGLSITDLDIRETRQVQASVAKVAQPSGAVPQVPAAPDGCLGAGGGDAEGRWEVTSSTITIVDADLVRIFDYFQAKQDVYVQLFRVQLDGQETLVGKTEECKEGNKNPRWKDEAFHFKRTAGNNQLKIRVLARKPMWKDTICGEAVLDLVKMWSEAESAVRQSSGSRSLAATMPLTLKKKGETTGEIRIMLEPKAPRLQSQPIQKSGQNGGAEVLLPSRRRDARAGTGAPRMQEPIPRSLRNYMNRPEEMRDMVREVFFQVAKPQTKGGPPMLTMEDLDELGDVLAGECHMPPAVFGDLKTLFWRFDFNCDNLIDEKEGVMMIESMIRRYRDAVTTQVGAMQLGEAIEHMKVDEKYDQGKELGRGGQAIVHLATQRDSGRQVVLKMYTKNNPDMPVEDITAEFELLIKLKHPKIARYYEIFQDAINFYIVSEPYFGGDLTKLVTTAHTAGVKVTEAWLARIVLQIAQGISFLHTNYIMHCDLKEANVMVADNSNYQAPQVVVIDFGLANHLSSMSAGGGSPGYMPPEVWDTGLWTPRGDVFSLGCITYSLCFGSSPFLEGCRTIEDVREMTKVLEPEMTFGSQSMRDIVNQMLRKKLLERPSIKQVIDSQWFADQIKQEGQSVLHMSIIGKFAERGRKTDLRRALLADIASRENLAQLHELNNLFSSMDKDNDGVLSSAEVRQALLNHGINAKEADSFVSALVGESGDISYEEFMVQLMTSRAKDEELLMERIFREADTQGRGQLDIKDIAQLLERKAVKDLLGTRSAAATLDDMDKDRDGFISLEEFKLAMHGVPKEHRGLPPGGSTLRVATATRAPQLSRGQGSRLYYVGQEIEYYSTSYSSWLPGKVDAVDQATGAVQVDNKPGWWLKGLELKKLRPKSLKGGPGEDAGKAGVGRQVLTGAYGGLYRQPS